jgi:hypothetical protein
MLRPLGKLDKIGGMVTASAQLRLFKLGMDPADRDVSEGSRTNWSTEEPPHRASIPSRKHYYNGYYHNHSKYQPFPEGGDENENEAGRLRKTVQ